MRPRRFSQVDVFGSTPLGGNPVAVVHDADGLADEDLAAFASWTNLSETTFLLPPTTAEADYRVRILTPTTELPFAGHPTIGTAHAWLEAGGSSGSDEVVVQECGAGLVAVRRGDRLAFAAPPLQRAGPVDEVTRATMVRALRVSEDEVLDAAWVDNGPGWVAMLLSSAEVVLGLEPDFAAFEGLEIGVVGEYGSAAAARLGVAVEVRAFVPSYGIPEDPVTGSLNAGIAQWLTASGRLPAAYVAAQGTRLGRAGRIHLQAAGDTVWVGGDAVTRVSGEVRL